MKRRDFFRKILLFGAIPAVAAVEGMKNVAAAESDTMHIDKNVVIKGKLTVTDGSTPAKPIVTVWAEDGKQLLRVEGTAMLAPRNASMELNNPEYKHLS